ncbi:MAG: hypothetical protein HRT47_01590 [Candidatus Caenarcaniphilales bacterium]|nr:hypothetical protein [Candidatus Caenarcaniphilales bacterium]
MGDRWLKVERKNEQLMEKQRKILSKLMPLLVEESGALMQVHELVQINTKIVENVYRLVDLKENDVK